MFSSHLAAGTPLPFAANDYRTRRLRCHPPTLRQWVQALVLNSVPASTPYTAFGAPPGRYWDQHYHLHPSTGAGQRQRQRRALPAFQRAVVPGWLDKSLKWRHRSTHFLDDVIVAGTKPAWVATRQTNCPSYRFHPAMAVICQHSESIGYHRSPRADACVMSLQHGWRLEAELPGAGSVATLVAKRDGNELQITATMSDGPVPQMSEIGVAEGRILLSGAQDAALSGRFAIPAAPCAESCRWWSSAIR